MWSRITPGSIKWGTGESYHWRLCSADKSLCCLSGWVQEPKHVRLKARKNGEPYHVLNRKNRGNTRVRHWTGWLIARNSSPRDKMATISQTTFSSAFSRMKKICILIRNSLKLVPTGPIDNKSVLVQVMAWRRTGDKLLHEPIPNNIIWHCLNQCWSSYMRH